MKKNDFERTPVEISVELCNEKATLPKYAKYGDSGMDVHALEDITILPGETIVIPLGIKVIIPNGYELQVRPRSGISLKTPLRIANSPGTIDSKYRDKIGVIMQNTSAKTDRNFSTYCNLETKNKLEGVYEIKAGDRVAQLVLQEVPKVVWKVVDSVLEDDSNDRGGGFGSTGIK